MKKEQNN